MSHHSTNQINLSAPEYNRLCIPVVFFSFICIGIAVFGIVYGFSALLRLVSPISESMELGNQLFGIYGAALAGQSKVEAISNLKNMNPALQDVEDYTNLLFLTSIILGLIITALCGVTIARTKNKNKMGVNTLSVYYFISGISAIVIIVLFCTLLIAENASKHYSEPHYIIPNTLLSAVLIGAIIFFFFRSYHPTLVKMVNVRPIQMTHNRPNATRNFTTNNVSLTTQNLPDANKPTKSCPYCGETILAVAVKCKHCGEWLPKEEEKKKVECPVCGEMVEEGMEVCPYCNERMDGSSIKRHEPQVRMIACPVCAEQIPDNVEICPICNEKIK